MKRIRNVTSSMSFTLCWLGELLQANCHLHCIEGIKFQENSDVWYIHFGQRLKNCFKKISTENI